MEQGDVRFQLCAVRRCDIRLRLNVTTAHKLGVRFTNLWLEIAHFPRDHTHPWLERQVDLQGETSSLQQSLTPIFFVTD